MHLSVLIVSAACLLLLAATRAARRLTDARRVRASVRRKRQEAE